MSRHANRNGSPPARYTDIDRRSVESESSQRRHEVYVNASADEEHCALLAQEYTQLLNNVQRTLGKFLPDERNSFIENCRKGWLDTILSNARYQYLRLTMDEAAHLLGRIILRQVTYPVPVKEWESLGEEVAKRSPAAADFVPVSEYRPNVHELGD
jgi:hypothetical protein